VVDDPRSRFDVTTLDELIVAQARRTPAAPAVVQGSDQLTYAELVGRAGALAATLRERGAGPESRVGICLPRDPALLVAAVGVLISGGCYVPLDPAHPEARRRDILADAGARIVVGDGPGMVPVPTRGAELPPPSGAVPDHLAHVLYTSGSTGRPKGVLTTHRNMVEFIDTCAAMTGAGPGTRSVGFASLGFDAATMDYFLPLTVGGSVQLVSDADRADPARLERFLAGHRANWCFITPAVLALLDPGALPDLALVMCGGEVFPPELARKWLAPGRRLLNVYGPTETTVLATMYEVEDVGEGPLPLGRPLPGHRAHVVDGELLIGGPGLARGYLDRPGLTADRFVPDPFSGIPGERLYRTGDQARIRDDGLIEFLGRGDGQVKVRGQRIETGEVEAVLREIDGVEQAVVEAVEGTAGLELVAFVTPADAPSDAALRAADRLTKAMVPRRVVRLEALPRNASDKVDRHRLRALAAGLAEADEADGADGADGAADSATGPLTGVEEAVAGIWRRLLGHRPGRDAEFTSSGGNSITAMRLVGALRAELARDVSVEDVFTGRTLAGLAERVAAAAELADPGLSTGNPPTLSPQQRRLWFTDQLAPDEAPYNIALAQRLRGPLDIGALAAALTAVSDHHEVLRWRVPSRGGVPYPVCDPPSDLPLPVVDIAEPELRARLAADARTVFDLAVARPWRATLYRLAPDDHVLAITVHHLVFDGWSQRILYDDLAAAYAGRPLARRAASYADYAVWGDQRNAERGEADLAWWAEHLSGVPTVVDLPRDRPRPAVASYRGAEATTVFPAAADAAVRSLAADLGTTPASVLLAGFGQLLRRVTDGGAAVIGAVVADRRLAEFDDQIGFFIDMVPVLLAADDRQDFASHVRRAAAELLDAVAHPGAPLERLVERLGLPRDPSRPPLVQIMFNVLNFDEPLLALPEATAEAISVDKPGSPLDLTVYVSEREGRHAVDVLYNTDLFDADRIERLLADYAALVGALAADAAAPVADIAPDLPAVVPPPPGAMGVRTEAAPPDPSAASGASSATEQAVAESWCRALGLARVDAGDNFFDVGGHSMALVAVHAQLAERLAPSLRVVDLFRYPTVRSLAAFIDGAVQDTEISRARRRAEVRRGRAAHRTPRRPLGNGSENE
jgi:amino acid adenylation domain-containing protein